MTIKPTTQRRIASTLFLGQGLYSATTILSFTLFPILAAQLSGNDSWAGMPSTAVLIGRALSAYIIGRIMAQIGRRWGLSIGYASGMIGGVLCGLAVVNSSFVGLLVGAAFIGIGRGGIDQGRFAAAEIFPINQRAKVVGWIVFAGTIGAVGGPYLVPRAKNWAQSLNWVPESGPYFLAGLTAFIGLVLIVLFVYPDPLKLAQQFSALDEFEQAKKTEGEQRPFSQITQDPWVRLAIASMIIGQLVMVLIMVITPLHMNHMHHTTEAISGVIMAHTLGMFGLSSISGWLIDRLGRLVIIVFGCLLLLVSAILTPFVSTAVWLGIALFLLGLGWNFCYVAGSSLLTDTLQDNEKASVQGTSDMLVSLASGTGSFSTGFLFNTAGIIGVCVIGLIFVLVLAGMAWWTRTQKHAPQTI